MSALTPSPTVRSWASESARPRVAALNSVAFCQQRRLPPPGRMRYLGRRNTCCRRFRNACVVAEVGGLAEIVEREPRVSLQTETFQLKIAQIVHAPRVARGDVFLKRRRRPSIVAALDQPRPSCVGSLLSKSLVTVDPADEQSDQQSDGRDLVHDGAVPKEKRRDWSINVSRREPSCQAEKQETKRDTAKPHVVL